jgi:hypothetical protein
LRNLLLSKELLVVLCFVFWFWFLSFSFLLLFVLGSFGYRHNRSGAAVVAWSRLQRGLWWPAAGDGSSGVSGAGCPVPCRRLRRVVPSIVQAVIGGSVLRHRGLRWVTAGRRWLAEGWRSSKLTLPRLSSEEVLVSGGLLPRRVWRLLVADDGFDRIHASV